MKKTLIMISFVFSVLLLVVNSNLWAGLDDGLVAHYSFTGNANDTSGNSHNGVVHGATLTSDRFGNPNCAYHFNGHDAYIEIANHNQLLLMNQTEFTISLWVNASDTYGLYSTCDNDWTIMETIFSNMNGEAGSCFTQAGGGTPEWYAQMGYYFGFRKNNLQFYLRNLEDDFTNDISVDNLPAPDVGSWCHIVLQISTVWDVFSHVAGENTGHVSMYIDGVKQDIGFWEVIPFPNDYNHSKPLYLGAQYYDRQPCLSPCVLNYVNGQEGMSNFFFGAIDDVRIYNRILSETEVGQLYNLGDNINYIDGAYNYFLPYYRSDSGYWSGFGISNSSKINTSPFSITVYGRNGSVLATEYPNPLPINGQASQVVAATLGTTGWLRINSHEELTGLSFFGREYVADVPFVDKVSKILMIPHVAQNSMWDTYLLICNPNNTPVTMTLTFYNQDGNAVATNSSSLPPLSSDSYPLANTFSGLPALIGKVQVMVTQGDGVAAFALYTNQKSGGSYFAGINAADVSEPVFVTPF